MAVAGYIPVIRYGLPHVLLPSYLLCLSYRLYTQLTQTFIPTQ